MLIVIYDWKIILEFDLNVLYGNELVDNFLKYKYNFGSNFNFLGWNYIVNVLIYLFIGIYYCECIVGNFGNILLVYCNMLYLNVIVCNDIVLFMLCNNCLFIYFLVLFGFIFIELEVLKNDVLIYGKICVFYVEVG